MKPTNYVVLGAFILLCLGGILWAAITLGPLALGPRDTRIVYFGADARVEAGVEILTAGTTVGQVDAVELVPDDKMAPGRYIRVEISLREGLTLWRGAEMVIVPRSPLGGELLVLNRGEPGGEIIPLDEPLQGRSQGGLMDSLTRISEYIESGEGLITTLLFDKTLANDVKQGVTDLREVIANAKAGRGTIGALLTEKDLYDEFKFAVGDLRKILAQLREDKAGENLAKSLEDLQITVRWIRDRVDERDRNGGGVLSVLLDDEANADLNETIASIKTTSSELNALLNEDGTIQRLLREQEVYEQLLTVSANLESASADLSEVAAEVNRGEGTLGRLIRDDALYDEAKRMLEAFREGGEISRENAPLATVVTFSAFLFTVLN
jgi:phospholipid/cholesterol/gamma-HCH transport system substrate-binding protein